jgi:hypothetical protein
MIDVIEDVLLRDAATGSGAVDLIQIHIVLASELANQG